MGMTLSLWVFPHGSVGFCGFSVGFLGACLISGTGRNLISGTGRVKMPNLRDGTEKVSNFRDGTG